VAKRDVERVEMDPGHVLELSTRDGSLAVALLGPAGDVLASGPVTLDVAALEKVTGPPEYGGVLVRSLLGDPVEGAMRGAGVTRVRLVVADKVRSLHGLRWECLLTGMRGPLSRLLYPESTERARLPQTEWPLRIVVAISDPTNLARFGLAPLDIDLEWAEFQRALRPLQGLVEVDLVEPPVTLDRISEALEQEPNIFHYLGHGAFHADSGEAALFLEKEADRTVEIVDHEDWITRLQALRWPPHLMVLTACESAAQVNEGALVGLAPALVEAGAGAVLAMRDKVGMDVAREFVYHFYRRLATHGEIDLAVNEARKFLLDRGGWSWTMPSLFMEWGAERVFATPPAMLEAMPARSGERLILIPEFKGHEAAFFEINLRDTLQAHVAEAGLQNVRVVWLERTEFGPGDDDEVRRLAARYGAALVLWGWYDRGGFRANFSVTESLFAYRDPTVFRSGTHVRSLFQSQDDFAIYVNGDLPRQVDYFVFFTLGQLYYWEGKYDGALGALDRAIAAAEAEAPGDQPEGLAYAYFYRGNLYAVHRQDRPAAIADYRRSLALAPTFAGAAFNLGGSLRIWANTFRASGDEDAARQTYQEAIVAYGQAIDIDPEHALAYDGRALTHYEIGVYEAAVADYRLALAREPRAETYHQLGLALRNLKRWDEALEALDVALARAPGMGRYHFSRGRLHAQMGDEERAAADLRAYLRLAPSSDAERRERVKSWLAQRGHSSSD
jgi:tetratricopeptide (TPR) repeat protein